MNGRFVLASGLEAIAWVIPGTLVAGAVAFRMVMKTWLQTRSSRDQSPQAERIEALESELDALRREVRGLAEAEAFHRQLAGPGAPAAEKADTVGPS